MTDLAGLLYLVEGADALGHRHVTAARPVQEKQVDMVGPQLFQALVDRGEEVAMRIFVDPDLGGEEDVGARHAGIVDGFADLGLVAVDLGRVDMVEAELERFRQHPQHVGAGHAEGTEAERRDVGTV
ncbi:hypothetical protein D9M72_562050 [compost metagenome]